MLALLDSLLDAGFDPEDQGRRSLAWFDTGAYAPGAKVFDFGGATSRAMAALRSGTPAVDPGPTGERDCGNGSLMRILPLALVERGVSVERLVDMAHLASRVTHGHPRCQVACALYSLLVRGLLAAAADRATTLADARSRLRGIYAEAGLTTHLGALDELEGWTGRSGRGFVLDSFWSAWDAFAVADSYRDAVVRAIEYGEDTDTTAAIAGGLAGTWFGIDDIPAEWRSGLRDPEIVRPLVDRLIETDTSTGHWRTSTASPLRVDPVVPGPTHEVPGRIGITFLPGKRGTGMSGHHWRDLDADLERLKAWTDTLVLLVEDHELVEAGVSSIAAAATRHGIELIRFPIPDPHAPRGPGRVPGTRHGPGAARRPGTHRGRRVSRRHRPVRHDCRLHPAPDRPGCGHGDRPDAGWSEGLDHAAGAAGIRAKVEAAMTGPASICRDMQPFGAYPWRGGSER